MTDAVAIPRSVPCDGRVPIVLGVTGHRTMPSGSVSLLRNAVAEECRKLAADYPNTPFLLLSGLAEGADRLVADVALKELRECALIAVLPMPAADFERDFQTEASRAEFAGLLGRAQAVVTIETPASGDWRADGEPRNEQYAKVGAAIAEHAQVLFALWDGQPSRGTGGTADVVAWFRRGYAPNSCSFYKGQLSPLDPPEPGLLIRIDPASPAPKQEKTQALDKRESDVTTILGRTEIFNRQVKADRDLIGKNYPLLNGLSSGDPSVRAAAERAAAAAPLVKATYDAADTLAVKLQAYVRRFNKALYLLALIAFVLFNLFEQAPWLSAVYFVVVAIMVVLWRIVRRTTIDNRFLEYRALAEAMRVLFFWRLAKVERAAWLSYLPKHSGVVRWVRHALRTIEFQQKAADAPIRKYDASEGLELARSEWISAQIAYYAKARDRHEAEAARWLRVSLWSLRISYVLAALFMLLAVAVYFGGFPFTGSTAKTLQIILGTAAAIGIAARGYLERQADQELVKQYTAALQMFTIARQEIDKALEQIAAKRNPDWRPLETLERLGIEALTEHGEWLSLRHSRPFDVPK